MLLQASGNMAVAWDSIAESRVKEAWRGAWGRGSKWPEPRVQGSFHNVDGGPRIPELWRWKVAGPSPKPAPLRPAAPLPFSRSLLAALCTSKNGGSGMRVL